MNVLVFIFVITILIDLTCFVLADPIVCLPNGKVRGHELQTGDNKTIYAFQAIPYAAPPLGRLRFQAPVPPKNWEGILNANVNQPDCINRVPFNDYVKSEDCLYLNVYAPKFNTNAPNGALLPVMFWIYGGSYQSGTSTHTMYGPDYLVQEGIVFVSFNYRLGPFGFLSTEDTVIPGNAGLKDQNLALKWVYQNIHLFGGDPKKITIFGESVGSISVTYHLLSEKSQGLFRAAIGASGTALATLALTRNPKDYAIKIVNKIAEIGNASINNNTLTSVKILEILRLQTTESIQQAVEEIAPIKDDKGLFAIPCLEIPHKDAFLTESSFELLRDGKFNRVPSIMGFNSEEYLFYFMQSLDDLNSTAQSYDEKLEYLIPIDLVLEDTTNKTEVAEAIKSIYLNSNQSFANNLEAAVKYGSDNIMTRSIIKYANLVSKITNVYFYQFSYHGNMGMLQNYSIDGSLGKVGHGEEMPYLFKMVYSTVNTTDLSNFSSQDILVHKRFIKLWTNFAKYLNPTPGRIDVLQNITWPALNKGVFQYLDIGENLELVDGYPRGNSFPLWNNIYNTYGARPFYTF